MRIGISALLAICLVTTASAQEPPRLRVLTYNIHHGEGTDGRLDLKRIADIINAAHPDLVALQEVDIKTERVGGRDEGALLARLTGMAFVPGDNIDYRGGRYGNGALVRGEVLDSENHLLPPSTSEQRGVLEIHVRIGDELPDLQFLVTHFDYRRADKERLASVAVINEMVKEDAGPAILAGDLNDTPQSTTLNRLGKQWGNPTAGLGLLTSPAGHPVRQIDFLLVRPGKRWQLISAKVLEEAIASDHRPVLLVLEWQGKTP